MASTTSSRFVTRFACAGCMFVLSVASTSLYAGSVAGFGGSTEITQVANNIQLVGMTAKQATAVAEAITTRIATVNQYIAMLQNLKNLPAIAMMLALAPYKEQVADLGKLLNATNRLKATAEMTQDLMHSRVTDARLLNLSMGEYLRREANLANTKAGVYKSRYEQDIKAIDGLQARAKELRTLSESNPAIAGNIQGLQQLNQHASMTAGELMEIRSVLLTQNIDTAQEKQIQQFATQAHSDDMARTFDKAKQRVADNQERLTFKDPWQQNWFSQAGPTP